MKHHRYRLIVRREDAIERLYTRIEEDDCVRPRKRVCSIHQRLRQYLQPTGLKESFPINQRRKYAVKRVKQ
jgi:hypothetical protein